MPTSRKKLSVSADEWAELASIARELLSKSRHGQYQAIFDQLSVEHGINEQVIRRAVAAHRFLDKLGLHHAELAKELRKAPFVAVEQIDRWFVHDPEGAIAAARAYLRGDESVRSLVNKEVEARPQMSLVELSINHIRKLVAKVIGDALPGDYRRFDPPDHLKTSSAKLYFRSYKFPDNDQIAVIRLGPNEHMAAYARHTGKLMLEAIGLRTIGFKVIIAILGDCYPDLFDEFYLRYPSASSGITICHITSVEAVIPTIQFR
ncbi:MAG: hypothetical protein K2X57_28790 [Xanthobacteraceae bacterium]|nr:hypothetical protein [Xanthobacteraceae bacterium]